MSVTLNTLKFSNNTWSIFWNAQLDLGVAAFDGVVIQLWFSPLGWNTTDTTNTSFTNFICQGNVIGNGTKQNQTWSL
jgi:hypothetical protein